MSCGAGDENAGQGGLHGRGKEGNAVGLSRTSVLSSQSLVQHTINAGNKNFKKNLRTNTHKNLHINTTLTSNYAHKSELKTNKEEKHGIHQKSPKGAR